MELKITCAVCNTLSNPLILGSDVVNRLHSQLLLERSDASETSNVYLSNDHVESCVDENVSDVVVTTDQVDLASDDDDVMNVDDAPNTSHSECDGSCKLSAESLKQEQRDDKSLKICFDLASKGKAGYFVHDGILYHKERIFGQEVEQLCLPKTRRAQAIKLAHDTFGGHLASKKTKARLKLSFTWPTIAADVNRACEVCDYCQKHRRVTVYDRVPISPVPRSSTVFDCFVMDTLGPLFPNQNVKYNYCLVLIDSCSRYPVAFPLKSLTAKCVCNALLQMFQTTGIPSVIQSDCGTNFTSSLTKTFLSWLGCSPRFNVPGRPQQSGLCERLIGTLKSMISKVAIDHPKSWFNHLGYILWALREAPQESLGVPPWLVVYGRLPRGPLAVLKENWTGHRDAPLSLGKTTEEYLQDLRKNLETAESYASAHLKEAQRRYISRYNLRSRPKTFTVGEQVLILTPNTTSSKVFKQWKSGVITQVKSPQSYMVKIDDAVRHVHVDKLRKYHVQVDEILCDAQVYDVPVTENSLSPCAIIYEHDNDFGDVEVLNDSKNLSKLLPSQEIEPEKLAHLSEKQRNELLSLLDKHRKCFSQSPGLCDLIQHEIHVTADFKPKRLAAYRVPEALKAEVQKQIDEMLTLGIIKPSKSEMASPIVCVLKGKYPKDGVRLAIDYRYVNRYTLGDAYPNTDIETLIQKIGKSNWISTFDMKSAYFQVKVKPEHQWLTAFVWDGGLYEFTRSPFGQKNSGNTFQRLLEQLLHPLRQFAANYVDDMSVFSQSWFGHLEHLDKFLQTIGNSGLTLNLKKCCFAQNEVRFLGRLVGSGQQLSDLAPFKT